MSVKVLEIGSWIGDSALVWANAVEVGSVTCIDPWKPYASESDRSGAIYREIDDALESGEAYGKFLDAISKAPPAVRMYHHKMTLREAVRAGVLAPDYGIVFIDGSHYLEDVREDLMLASALLRIGGILCGDDLEKQLHEIPPDSDVLSSIDLTDYAHGAFHPGVTVAVGEFFGGEVWSDSGFWAMQKTATGWENPV